MAATPLSGNQWAGPAVRAQAGGQDLYVGFYFWDNGSPELMLFLRDNGNWSQLGGATSQPASSRDHPVADSGGLHAGLRRERGHRGLRPAIAP